MKRQKALFIAKAIIEKYDINVFPNHLAETIGNAEWNYNNLQKTSNKSEDKA